MLRSIGIGWGLLLQALHASGSILVSMGRQKLPLDAEPHGICLHEDTGKMYWTDSGPKARLQKANFNGEDTEVIMDGAFQGLVNPKGIAVHNTYDSKIYFTDSEAKKIQRAELDGSLIQDVVSTGLGEPGFLALDHGEKMIYWTDPKMQKIQVTSMANGTNVTDIFNGSALGTQKPEGIVVVPETDALYWADPVTSKICKSNMNGSAGITDLVVLGQGYNQPYGLAYDDKAKKLYWTDRQMKIMSRVNVDGSELEEVTAGLGDPLGIAFDSVAGTVYWCDAGRINISRLRVDQHANLMVVVLSVGAGILVLGGVGAAIFMHVPLGHFFGNQCSRMRSRCSRMKRGRKGAGSISTGDLDAEESASSSRGSRGLLLSTGEEANRTNQPLYPKASGALYHQVAEQGQTLPEQQGLINSGGI